MSGANTPFRFLREHAFRLDGKPTDYDALLAKASDRDLVLLGEATHGTHEFYRMRAEITQQLIEEKHFDGVVAEADWPDAWRLNHFVRGSGDARVEDAFMDFERFPEWMWRNHDVRDFVTWLHDHNAGLDDGRQTGFYGMDLYSLYRSADAVVSYLDMVDPMQAEIARNGYACLDHVRDPQQYGYQATFGLRPNCRKEAIDLLVRLHASGESHLRHDGRNNPEEQFAAEQNARIVVNAEKYYRAMFGSRENTWNLRDDHMTLTIQALREHLLKIGGSGKLVVWAHNSHLGDARATDMGRRGEHNIGQLLRQHAGKDKVLLVGFTTYTGHVSAARNWDEPVEHRWVRPALEGSYEKLFHSTGLERFCVALDEPAALPMHVPMLERAIGVIYRPETERSSHYFNAAIGKQFDLLFHVDETSAVEPLDPGTHWHQREMPETYPFGV